MSDFAKLFRWKKKVEIKSGEAVIGTAFIQLVGDVEYQEARNLALKGSRALRIKLRDKTSSEFAVNFSDVDVMTKDELINGIIISEISDYRDEAMLTMKDEPEPELPDNPTLEQQEDHEAKLEEIKDNKVKTLSAALEKRGEKRRKELDKADIEDIKKLYIVSMTNVKAVEEFARLFREYQVFKGTFKDENYKEPAFTSFEEFAEASPTLKQQLASAYIGLEISGEDLKN